MVVGVAGNTKVEEAFVAVAFPRVLVPDTAVDAEDPCVEDCAFTGNTNFQYCSSWGVPSVSDRAIVVQRSNSAFMLITRAV